MECENKINKNLSMINLIGNPNLMTNEIGLLTITSA